MSAIIPALNEAVNLPHVLTRIPDIVDELILVDGRSTDGTAGIARLLRPDAKLVIQDGQGKGNALACGFHAAGGDVIVMLDADGSTDPAEIPRFLAPLWEGADFVKGSRFLEGGGSEDMTRLRRAGNRVLTGLVNLLFDTRYTDLCYGYNAFWRSCLDDIHLDADGFEVETLMNIRIAVARRRVAEVPSVERKRLHGGSHLRTFRDGARVLRTILRERLRRPRSRGRSGSDEPPNPTVLEPIGLRGEPAGSVVHSH